jgi:drug/metabolite transporter (DMT)-like permease
LGVLLVAIILISLNPVWIHYALAGGASPLWLIVWQAIFSVSAFTVYALLFNRRLLNIRLSVIPSLFATGIFGFFIMALLFTLSLQRLHASLTVTLFFAYPFFVMAGGAIFKRTTLKFNDVAAMAFLLSGVVIAARPDVSGDITGVLFAIGAAMAQAFFMLHSESHLQKINPLQVAVFAQYGFFLGSMTLLPLFDASFWLPSGILYGLILALLSSFLGFILYLRGIKSLGAKRAAVVSVLNMPLSLVFTAIILKDVPTRGLWPGILLILAGIMIERMSAINR